jgi:hypothetical protein
MRKIFILAAFAALLLGCSGGSGAGSGASQAGGGALTKVSGVARKPAEGVTVYLYRPGDDLRGPPFSRIGPVGADGAYSVDLPPGDYIFLVRQRVDGEESGPVLDGDVKSDPVSVKVEAGKPLALDLNAFVKQGNAKESFGAPAQWKTLLGGKITDPEGKPVEGIRVQAYTHVQMSERPKFVSARTGPDGKYSLPLPEGGTFYLCARDKYGGPPKVGDLYGRYDQGTVEPSGVTIAEGQTLDNVNIIVHSVW